MTKANKKQQSRREFLARTAVALAGIMVGDSALVHAIGRIDEPRSGPLASVLIALARDFLIAVGVELTSKQVARSIGDWISDLGGNSSEEGRNVISIDNIMIGENFTIDRSSNVYDIPIHNHNALNCFCYGRESNRHDNACCAFLDPAIYNQVAMVEGPIIIGLSSAAKDWHSKKAAAASRYSISEALVPIQQVQIQDSPAPITQSLEIPHVFRTSAGLVGFDYAYSNATQAGRLVVSAADNAGEILFEEEYDVGLQTMDATQPWTKELIVAAVGTGDLLIRTRFEYGEM